MILKDVSNIEDAEAVFEVVEDDSEADAVIGVFESLLDDVSIVADDSSEIDE